MSWKEELYKLDLWEPEDLDQLANENNVAKTDDVGFINSSSGAGILGRADGVLEGFADFGLGFRFNPDSQSLLVFAPNLHIFSNNIQKHDKIVKNTYLKDEHQDVMELLGHSASGGEDE